MMRIGTNIGETMTDTVWIDIVGSFVRSYL